MSELNAEAPNLETAGSLKDRILAYVRYIDHVSFAELANRFGSEFCSHGKDEGAEIELEENVALWTGMTREGAQAVIDLVAEKSIRIVPTTRATYLIDDAALALPIAKRARKYKTPHWVPVVLRPAATR